MGLECAIIMGRWAIRNCEKCVHFCTREFTLGILCGKRYATENVWGSVFLSLSLDAQQCYKYVGV